VRFLFAVTVITSFDNLFLLIERMFKVFVLSASISQRVILTWHFAQFHIMLSRVHCSCTNLW